MESRNTCCLFVEVEAWCPYFCCPMVGTVSGISDAAASWRWRSCHLTDNRLLLRVANREAHIDIGCRAVDGALCGVATPGASVSAVPSASACSGFRDWDCAARPCSQMCHRESASNRCNSTDWFHLKCFDLTL